MPKPIIKTAANSSADWALFACLLSSLRLRHLPCQMVSVEQMV